MSILVGRRRFSQSFMIDTGADYTLVQRGLAIPLLTAAGVDPSGDFEGSKITLSGVGPTPLNCLVQPAGLSFVDEDDEEYVLSSPLLIPQPSRDATDRREPTVIPSLLGRDVLQCFDLHLSYDPPSVTLTLND